MYLNLLLFATLDYKIGPNVFGALFGTQLYYHPDRTQINANTTVYTVVQDINYRFRPQF